MQVSPLEKKRRCHALPHRFNIQPKACRSVQPYRRPANLPHLPEARWHLPFVFLLQPSRYNPNDYKEAYHCWTNNFEGKSTKRSGDRWGETLITSNPFKYLSNAPGAQASASQPPDRHWITSLNCTLQVGCCVSLHPLGGAEHKRTPFPNPCR